jgi:ABC-type branched-subunit amino acid transport system ATPase component
MTDGATIVLEARDIARAFPGVQALAGVNLTLRAGEVHALMGQNGAGKSTLIKVLTGVYAPDAGSIELAGQKVVPQSPIHAQQLGISAVHQESHLLPNLSVAENICAGRYPKKPLARGGGIDWRETERHARALLARLGIDLDVTQLAGGLSAALQQLATVARAVATDARVLILDEPTLESGRRGSASAVRAHPQAARPGRGHPVRHAFSRPGVRDLRSHDGSAQRPVRRRIRLLQARCARARGRDGGVAKSWPPKNLRPAAPLRPPATRRSWQLTTSHAAAS